MARSGLVPSLVRALLSEHVQDSRRIDDDPDVVHERLDRLTQSMESMTRDRQVRCRDVGQVLALMVAVGVAAWIGIGRSPSNPHLYLLFVPTLWPALRCGTPGAVAAMVVTWFHVAIIAGAVPGVDGTRVSMFLVVHALTLGALGALASQRQKANRRAEASEQQLRVEHERVVTAERQFRLSFTVAPIGVALVHPEGHFLEVNDALCSIVGYSRSELLARTFQDITHPDDLLADLTNVEDVLAGRIERYTMDKRYVHRRGHHVTVQLDVSLVRDHSGMPLHFIAQIQDVTERRATIVTLQASEATQNACLEALEQGIVLSDLAGEVQFLNAGGQAILGMGRNELSQRFRTGQWQTLAEDGSLLPPEQRPIGITMRTGVPTRDRIVVWPRSDGSRVVLRLATQPVRDGNGSLTGVVTAFTDVTAERAAARESQAAVERLRWQADHDALTGLVNRRSFIARVADELASAQVVGSRALLFLDLDRFKEVNDSLGHAAGDELLVSVAARLRASVRPQDLVARLGGDEFVVFATDLPTPSHASAVAERILNAMQEPFLLDAGPVSASASIGIAAVQPGTSADELLHEADLAMYEAKLRGPGRQANSCDLG
jgi:diguanylate cyclase (GGDEF)-like protein/PAS domain S-box-containing protein